MTSSFLAGCTAAVVGLAAALLAPLAPLQAKTPQPKAPQYETLKALYLKTPLTAEGKPAAAIISDGARYDGAAKRIQQAVKKQTGVSLPILSSEKVAFPFTQHVILLGNRSTNRLLSELYDRFYAMTDLKYPGAGGFEVRSVHNPLGNAKNAVILGGSDDAGVEAAAADFLREIKAGEEASVGWLLKVKPGGNPALPKEAHEALTWQESPGYGDRFFGWNSISLAMAAYYFTGEERYAREVVRLAFPDDQAKAFFEKVDGERIENKDDPLAGPYHYAATRMVLYWDLIEESPVFSDVEKLEIINALARQFEHRLPEGIYSKAEPSIALPSRHGLYSALSLYTLARYFKKDDDREPWRHAYRAAGEYTFAPLKTREPWIHGESDNLYWYGTVLAPILDYLVLSGQAARTRSNGHLSHLLETQELLWNGAPDDKNFRWTALDYLQKAAYLTGDDRWLYYRERLPLDTGLFRLDQSFWPTPDRSPAPPDSLVGRWSVHHLSPGQHREREIPFPVEQAFSNLSYRSAPDATGDFLLLDGMNGTSRNPSHTFAALDLRINGRQLLKGYLNQVRTSLDGSVEPSPSLDAALLRHGVLGETVFAEGDVSQMAWNGWQRHWVLRKGRFALAADRLSFRRESGQFVAEFYWQNLGENSWKASPDALASKEGFIVPADVFHFSGEETATRLEWLSAVKAGDERRFFTLLLPADAATGKAPPKGRKTAPNAALFQLPKPLLAFTGSHAGVEAGLALCEDDHFFALGLEKAPHLKVSAPVDLDWSYATGRLAIKTTQPVTLTLYPEEATQPLRSGKALALHDGAATIELAPGEHLLENTFPSASRLAPLARAMEPLPDDPSPRLLRKPLPSDLPGELPSLNVAAAPRFDHALGAIVPVPGPGEAVYYVNAGQRLLKLDREGNLLHTFEAPAPIFTHHWWADAGLVVIGTTDQRTLAYTPDGKLQWTFVSKMDDAVYQTGKNYWFPTANGHGGIQGLGSGRFIDGETQLFIGSACTLEVVDRHGKLLKRLPEFWGTPAIFQLIPASDGSTDLIVARRLSERATPHAINSRTLEPGRQRFSSVPRGHRYITGWTVQRNAHLFHVDLDGDGKKEVVSDITGSWNRISVWDEKSKPLHTLHFGPGPSPYRAGWKVVPALIRDTDIADLHGNGKMTIVTALSNRLLIALDARCEIQWSRRLDAPPLQLCIVGKTIVVALENGTLVTLDANGQPLSRTSLRPAKEALGQLVAGLDGCIAITHGQTFTLLKIPQP
ncbi:MAG TPA: hypothetical protein VNQ90_16395 [Chthoniobacteraceae bacterium]|nr:hypothetical protein [Chthoniobacteraceae bacterium]